MVLNVWVLAMSELAALAKSCSETSEFYRNYGARFEVGSLGYLGNLAEAEKYASMAARFSMLDRSIEHERSDDHS